MSYKRVVITGGGVVTPFGKGLGTMMSAIRESRSAVQHMPGWDSYQSMRCRLGAPAQLTGEKDIPRHKRRSMSALSIYSVQSTEEALRQAGLDLSKVDTERVGCVVGSTMGSANSINEFFETFLPNKDVSSVPSMLFFKSMSHTGAMNLAQYYGIHGHVSATCAACASGLMAIGTGYHLLRMGLQDVMLCGGAEELHPSVSGVFDLLYATTSAYADTPTLTPRPFDAKRDGIVCGEGAGIVVMETYDHAINRGARILAEIVGYDTSGSGDHISHSNMRAMHACMKRALDSAKIGPEKVGYINAHATATIQGDREEAGAIRELFGDRAPVSSLKGYFGHTLGASGAIELLATIEMARTGTLYPGLNLNQVAPDCEGIGHIMGKPVSARPEYFIKNCFAFGGVNAAMVCRMDH